MLIIANWILPRHVSVSAEDAGPESRYRGESIGILMRTSRWPIPN